MGIALATSTEQPDYSRAVAEAFPDIDCRHRPVAEFVIVQFRLEKGVTDGGIILTDEAKQTVKDNTQVARVVKIGPGAFCNRQTGEPWPSGAWYNVGDFVRAPKYGGDRWSVRYDATIPEHKRGTMIVPERTQAYDVEFALFKDLDIRTIVEGNPLSIRAYVL